MNPPTVPTPRIVNKGKDLSVRLGQSIKIPCEIINKGNICVKSFYDNDKNNVKHLHFKFLGKTQCYNFLVCKIWGLKYNYNFSILIDKSPYE